MKQEDLQNENVFAHLPPGAGVMVAFSGGVDSSVAIRLCQQASLQVQAVYLSLLGKENIPYEKLKRAADKLDVPLEILEYSSLFEEKIIRYCWEEYASARTPNPCTKCNPLFKFGILSSYAKEKGCAALIKGHYARILRKDGYCELHKGVFLPKDQSYFLFGLSQEQLSMSIFPLGTMSKEEVRQIAFASGLESAGSKESQDICFAPPDSSLFGESLRERFHGEAKCGCFLSPSGEVLGRHQGLHRYTIGQRKGTGVALGVPAYVTKLDAGSNNIILSTDEKDLFTREAMAQEASFLLPETERKSVISCEVKIRYRSQAVPAEIHLLEKGRVRIFFTEPQRAVTPGQAAVFYDGERVLGGAYLTRT